MIELILETSTLFCEHTFVVIKVLALNTIGLGHWGALYRKKLLPLYRTKKKNPIEYASFLFFWGLGHI